MAAGNVSLSGIGNQTEKSLNQRFALNAATIDEGRRHGEKNFKKAIESKMPVNAIIQLTYPKGQAIEIRQWGICQQEI